MTVCYVRFPRKIQAAAKQCYQVCQRELFSITVPAEVVGLLLTDSRRIVVKRRHQFSYTL